MKKVLFGISCFMLFCTCVDATKGCCSHHGGVAGCNSNGRTICWDGTLSPSCTCTPQYRAISGCTDSGAINYNSNATQDDNTCRYKKIVTDTIVDNYKTIYQDNDDLEYQKEEVAIHGVDGITRVEYEVITNSGGTEISRKEVNRVVVKERVDEVILVGTKKEEIADTPSGIVPVVVGGIIAYFIYKKKHKY